MTRRAQQHMEKQEMTQDNTLAQLATDLRNAFVTFGATTSLDSVRRELHSLWYDNNMPDKTKTAFANARNKATQARQRAEAWLCPNDKGEV